jgi:hypothetical protein
MNIYFMAKQAGIDSVQQHDSDTSSIELLKRFAEIVVAEEREACAKVCLTEWSTLGQMEAGEAFARAIRARGQ